MATGKVLHKHTDRVLRYLEREKHPLSAYQILDGLRGDGLSAANTVYRSLEHLQAAGRVHRIESLNAWTILQAPFHTTTPIFEICVDCSVVTEHSDPRLCGDIAELTERTGFAVERSVIEIHGRCGDCHPNDLVV